MPEKSGLPLASRGISAGACSWALSAPGAHSARATASESLNGRFMPLPSEGRADDRVDLPPGPDPVVANRRVVAEIVDAGGVLDVEQVLGGDADPRGHAADVNDHAEPGVGEVVGILHAVGRQQLLEVVVGAVGVVAVGVERQPAADLVLEVEADDRGPLGRADDLLAGVVAS